MARKFFFSETVPGSAPITTRLGAQNAPYKDTEIGKLVKMTTDSGCLLCAAGDLISGQIVAVEAATSDGYGIGTVQRRDRITAVADGLQATLGTGTLAVGDQVVCGTVVAKDTAMGGGVGLGRPRVAKATIQVGVTVPADLAAQTVHNAVIASGNVWKVISLGTGAGAVDTEVVIERVFNFG